MESSKNIFTERKTLVECPLCVVTDLLSTSGNVLSKEVKVVHLSSKVRLPWSKGLFMPSERDQRINDKRQRIFFFRLL